MFRSSDESNISAAETQTLRDQTRRLTIKLEQLMDKNIKQQEKDKKNLF